MKALLALVFFGTPLTALAVAIKNSQSPFDLTVSIVAVAIYLFLCAGSIGLTIEKNQREQDVANQVFRDSL